MFIMIFTEGGFFQSNRLPCLLIWVLVLLFLWQHIAWDTKEKWWMMEQHGDTAEDDQIRRGVADLRPLGSSLRLWEVRRKLISVDLITTVALFTHTVRNVVNAAEPWGEPVDLSSAPYWVFVWWTSHSSPVRPPPPPVNIFPWLYFSFPDLCYFYSLFYCQNQSKLNLTHVVFEKKNKTQKLVLLWSETGTVFKVIEQVRSFFKYC